MKRPSLIPLLNFVGIIAVIGINSMANVLPLNGVNTGQVSAEFDNLFTPAGFTFSIWSVIYLGLLVFTIFPLIRWKNIELRLAIAESVGFLFLLNCLANVAWIFSWHYYQFELTLVWMFLLLITLIVLNRRVYRSALMNGRRRWVLFLPVNIYLGWICVATIANIAVYLTANQWNGFGIPEGIWLFVLSFLACILAMGLIIKGYDPAGLVISWGLVGVVVKNSEKAFAHGDVFQLFASILILLIWLVFLFRMRIKRKENST